MPPNTHGPGWTLDTLEVRHRQRARAEDRIRGLTDTGMRNLPFHSYAANQIWLEIVSLAADLLAVAGRIIRTGRRQHLRLPRGWPWNHLIDTGYTALHTT